MVVEALVEELLLVAEVATALRIGASTIAVGWMALPLFRFTCSMTPGLDEFGAVV